MTKHKISHLEWHVAHGCNLTCEGCAHFSNHGHGGLVKYDDLKLWYDTWSPRLAPETIDLLGGEPLLNKEIYKIIELTRKSWDHESLECLNLQTNGFLLDRYPDLPLVLKDNNCKITLSQHGDSENYNKSFLPAQQILLEWAEKYQIDVEIVPCHTYWFEIYKGYGNNMMPYEDNDPEESWNNCITGQDCFQLLDNKIYKCCMLAYLPYQAKKYKLSPKWDHYLTYAPLTSDCTDDAIIEFFNKKAESYCGMCPKNPRQITTNDPTTPRAHYEKINLIRQ